MVSSQRNSPLLSFWNSAKGDSRVSEKASERLDHKGTITYC